MEIKEKSRRREVGWEEETSIPKQLF